MCAGFIVVVIFNFILPSVRLCVSLYKEQDTQKLVQKHQKIFCESLLMVLDTDSSQRLNIFGKTVKERVMEQVLAVFLCPLWNILLYDWLIQESGPYQLLVRPDKIPPRSTAGSIQQQMARKSKKIKWTQSNTVEEHFSRSQESEELKSLKSEISFVSILPRKSYKELRNTIKIILI